MSSETFPIDEYSDRPQCIRALAEKYVFVMPLIQRDFAFGREGEKRKRTNFVKGILDAYKSKSIKPLDFIYGTIEADRFVLLDGQQRLTVVMLFYWFFSRKPLGWKFSYVMRRVPDSFVRGLMSHAYDGSECPSAWTKKQKWFAPFWKADATVRGMLTVLDDIFEQLKLVGESVQIGADWLDRVVSYVKLIPEEEVRADNAYIKMNARGLPLTEWEKVKAVIDAELFNACKYNRDHEVLLEEWRMHVDGIWRDSVEDVAMMSVKSRDNSSEYVDCSDLREALSACDRIWLRILDAAIVLTITYKEIGDRDDERAALLRIGQHRAVFEDYACLLQCQARTGTLEIYILMLNAFANGMSVIGSCWTADRTRNALWEPVEYVERRFSTGGCDEFVKALLKEDYGFGQMLRHYSLTRFWERRDKGEHLRDLCFSVSRVLNLIDNSGVDKDNVGILAKSVDEILDDISSIQLMKVFGEAQREEECLKIQMPWGSYKTFERTHLLNGAISLFLRGDRIVSSRTWHAFLTYQRDFRALEKCGNLEIDAVGCFEQLLLSLQDEDLRSGDMLVAEKNKDKWRRLFRSATGIKAFSNLVQGVRRYDVGQMYGMVNSYKKIRGAGFLVDRIGLRGRWVFAMPGSNWSPKSVRLSYNENEQKNLANLSRWIIKRDCDGNGYVSLNGEDRNRYIKVSELEQLPPRFYARGENNEWVPMGDSAKE